MSRPIEDWRKRVRSADANNNSHRLPPGPSRLGKDEVGNRHSERWSGSSDSHFINLAWLAENQAVIEQQLFERLYPDGCPDLFLYDVTSGYLEGEHHALAAWGFNRDGKRGKQQIVIGLLCDGQGRALSIEVFAGNTSDPKTVGARIKKVVERFGGHEVTFVGDRGMIKGPQIQELGQQGFHYITAFPNPKLNRY